MAASATVQAVVDRAVAEPEFAEELRAQALRAIHAGAGSAEWREYFSQFAPSPEQLQAMSGATEDMAACTCNSKTATTTSTPFCTTTTTTTSG